MEEEKRLGNRDKGWNDPPSFAYDKVSQAQTTPRKNLLNQRVAMPQNYSSPSPTATGVSLSQPHSMPPPGANLPAPTGPPPVTGPPPANGPPPTTGPPPSTGLPPASGTGPGPTRVTKEETGKSPVCDDGDGGVSCDATVATFRKVFEQCQDKLQKRIISDIERRLKLLQDSWQNNKLSSTVQKRTAKLASDLQARKYDSAHEVHLSLMVDHVSEVSQWMVGIKRLIHEARTILPFQEVETQNSDAEERPRTIEQDQEPASITTGKGDADSVDSPGPEPRTESKSKEDDDATKRMDDLEINQS